MYMFILLCANSDQCWRIYLCITTFFRWILFVRPQIVANMSGCSLESTEKIAHCMKNLDVDTFESFGKVR